MDINKFYNKRRTNFIHKSSVIYDNVKLGENIIIEENCVIGKPHRGNLINKLTNNDLHDLKETFIDDGCVIQTGSVIYENVFLEKNVICNLYTVIGSGSHISKNTKLHYQTQIFKNVFIGENCRIGGFICNDAIIGANSSVYGSIVHKYKKHGGNYLRKAPRVGANVIIAFQSIVIGNIKIGDNSYVSPGAIVTKDMPENTIAIGVNNFIPKSDWEIQVRKIKNG